MKNWFPAWGAERKPWRLRRPSVRSLVILFGLILVGKLIAGGLTAWFWGQEPERFDVLAVAEQRAEQSGMSQDGGLPPGYVTISTLKKLIETMLEKPGGYLTNDPLPPGAFLDNIPSWEFGVLTQVRDFTLALRMELSRPHAQSIDRPELNAAQTHFAFAHDAWILPSAESAYREGLLELERYTQALIDESTSFTIRANALDGWLRKVERRLGGCSVQLRANAGADRYNPNVLTSDQDLPGTNPAEPVPFTQIDDVFYESRGTAWAIYHLLKGVKEDYEPVLDQMMAMGPMNRALSNLYASLEPLGSPMVLNGRDFGATPNHSLILAAYLANAHLAVSELRALLRNE